MTSQSLCSLSFSFLPDCTGISGSRLTGLTGDMAVLAWDASLSTTWVMALCWGLGLCSLTTPATPPSSLGAGKMLLSQLEAVMTWLSCWCWFLALPRLTTAFSLSLSTSPPFCWGKWTLWGRLVFTSRTLSPPVRPRPCSGGQVKIDNNQTVRSPHSVDLGGVSVHKSLFK